MAMKRKIKMQVNTAVGEMKRIKEELPGHYDNAKRQFRNNRRRARHAMLLKSKAVERAKLKAEKNKAIAVAKATKEKRELDAQQLRLADMKEQVEQQKLMMELRMSERQEKLAAVWEQRAEEMQKR